MVMEDVVDSSSNSSIQDDATCMLSLEYRFDDVECGVIDCYQVQFMYTCVVLTMKRNVESSLVNHISLNF